MCKNFGFCFFKIHEYEFKNDEVLSFLVGDEFVEGSKGRFVGCAKALNPDELEAGPALSPLLLLFKFIFSRILFVFAR